MGYLNRGFLSFMMAMGDITAQEATRIPTLGDAEDSLQTLLDVYALPEVRILAAFENFYGLPYVNLHTVNVFEVVSLHVSPDWLIARGLIPFFMSEKVLACALSEPASEADLSDIQAAFQRDVVFYLGDPVLIQNYLYDIYLAPQQTMRRKSVVVPAFSLVDASNGRAETVDRLIASLMRCALKANASDIHITLEGETCEVSFRVDGALSLHASLLQEYHDLMVNKLKLLAGMDIAEKRLPQEGRFTVDDHGRLIDIRVATLLLYQGEKMVLRLLPQAFTRRRLQDVDFSDAHITQLDDLLNRKQGFLLVTGPTNSGKSTTLYTFLKQLTREPLAIYTVEDPIEATIPGTHQVQVNRKGGLDFQTALRGILREDPDVILIGEIRDNETAQIAVRAALTGHLVLASLHAPFAHSALERLRDLGVSDALLSATLIGVVNQRLLTAVCRACGGTGIAADSVCMACGGNGKNGRMAVHEIWQVDEGDRQAIRAGADSLDLRQTSRLRGFSDLLNDAEAKDEAGLLCLHARENDWLAKEVAYGHV